MRNSEICSLNWRSLISLNCCLLFAGNLFRITSIMSDVCSLVSIKKTGRFNAVASDSVSAFPMLSVSIMYVLSSNVNLATGRFQKTGDNCFVIKHSSKLVPTSFCNLSYLCKHKPKYRNKLKFQITKIVYSFCSEKSLV